MAKSKRKDSLNFEAAMTKEELYENEHVHQSIEVRRKISLAVLTQSKAEMVKVLDEDFNLFEQLLENVQAYKEYLEDMVKITTIAEARLFSVGLALAGQG